VFSSFGYKFANVQKIADAYAAAGFRVLVHDMFNNGAMDHNTADFSKFGEWLKQHSLVEVTEITEKVLKVVRDELKATSIQMQGYCFGVKPIFNILAKADEYGIKGAVVAHPSFVTVDDAKTMQLRPILFNCAETDSMFGPQLRAAMTEAFKERKFPAEFIDYPGTQHGFAVRGDGSEHTEAAKLKAQQDSIKFFLKNA